MPKKRTQEIMKTLEKEKKQRARTRKGRFVADDPSTPQNEAYVQPSKAKAYAKHIKEATDKAQKKEVGLFKRILNKIARILFGVR